MAPPPGDNEGGRQIARGGEIIVREYCECNSPLLRGYTNYYDSPDGCDVRSKIGVTVRYGTAIGMIFGTYDILMYSHAVTFNKMIKRYATHILPLAGMGATFAAVANGVQNWRGRDDSLNYFFGGLACGPIMGYYLGSGHAVLIGGLLLGAIGVIKKWGIDDGWTFLPTPTPHMGLVDSWRRDYTLVEDLDPVVPVKEMRKICKGDDDPC